MTPTLTKLYEDKNTHAHTACPGCLSCLVGWIFRLPWCQSAGGSVSGRRGRGLPLTSGWDTQTHSTKTHISTHMQLCSYAAYKYCTRLRHTHNDTHSDIVSAFEHEYTSMYTNRCGLPHTCAHTHTNLLIHTHKRTYSTVQGSN